jgi:uncharacterized delta-60 repeat protein
LSKDESPNGPTGIVGGRDGVWVASDLDPYVSRTRRRKRRPGKSLGLPVLSTKRIQGFHCALVEPYARRSERASMRRALRGKGHCFPAGALGAFFLIVANAPSVFAAGGDLDTSFAGDGTVTTTVTHHGSDASGVAIQADGKIVVAGGSFGANPKFALARYRTDGSLSLTFGGDGKVTTDFTEGPDRANAVAIQPDGKIVAAGSTGDGAFALARYNPDGTLDPTFGGDGKVTTSFPSSAYAEAVVIQTDGKILVAGGTTNSIALARYNADGTLDPTFGGDGEVDESSGSASDVAIQADGKILTTNPLARYNADGTLDPTFTSGGVGDEMAIQADGRIMTGWTDVECFGSQDCDRWFVLDRFNPDGTSDVTFGVNGEVGPGDTYGNLDDIAIQTDGKIIACGLSGGGFLLARYLADGSLDAAFGKNGEVRTDFTKHTDLAAALAIQTDGKIVAAGAANESHDADVAPKFALSRYLP